VLNLQDVTRLIGTLDFMQNLAHQISSYLGVGDTVDWLFRSSVCRGLRECESVRYCPGCLGC
jgi:hypothetical protein